MIRRACGAWGAAALIAAVIGLGSEAGAAAAKDGARPSFFGTVEIASTNLKPFTKWNEAIARYSKEVAMEKQGTCDAKTMNRCHYAMLEKLVAAIRSKTPYEQIVAVNAQLNKAKYITDDVNWGEKDYWATPAEFMTKFGDCEDYAIAKYVTLRMLGFDENILRVVAVNDLNLKIGHAILIVFLDGKSYVLDNQIPQVVEAERIRHYQPVFSINRNFWWRHRPA